MLCCSVSYRLKRHLKNIAKTDAETETPTSLCVELCGVWCPIPIRILNGSHQQSDCSGSLSLSAPELFSDFSQRTLAGDLGSF